MSPAQITQATDELISELKLGPSPLAVKFAPYLQDHADLGQTVNDNDLAQIKSDALAFVQAAHAEAIARLREELANDPTGVGYAGKSPEEVQALLTTEVPIYVEQDALLTPSEVVAVGVALANDLPYKPTPSKAQVLVTIRPPRLGTIWSGIPYTRNLPSLDNIAEALK